MDDYTPSTSRRLILAACFVVLAALTIEGAINGRELGAVGTGIVCVVIAWATLTRQI